ncbi:hypothetical protein DSCOOX_32810 [Desulfosarcina ovata subsp. ovata]|uniref:Uncharacterized protein n=1 Tax=Desulfosarcina ovata subsp. ovata TaxID=2752305 RepID=A0A5K8AC36_9BACT|nr:hypothetical protein DSCOOX_32810 [Desulfosarcina ovata subsp. ovata]
MREKVFQSSSNPGDALAELSRMFVQKHCSRKETLVHAGEKWSRMFLNDLIASHGNVINISSYFARRMLPDRPLTAYSLTNVFLNVPTMQQPEAYLGNAASLFDESGDLANDSIKDFVTSYINAFAAWVETNTANRQ